MNHVTQQNLGTSAHRHNSHVKNIVSAISSFLWPRFCVVCGRAENYACADCAQQLPYVPESACTICGRPFPKGDTSPPAHPCGACLKEGPDYDLHRALFVYDGVIRELTHKLKYGAAFWVGDFYHSQLGRLGRYFDGVELIVPVPLHTARLKERGYNQSVILAQALVKYSGKPLACKLLTRTRSTPAQTGLSQSERHDNLKGVFSIAAPALIDGKTVLLVDDVHTTGTTLNLCARELKKRGAAKVLAATFAVVP